MHWRDESKGAGSAALVIAAASLICGSSASGAIHILKSNGQNVPANAATQQFNPGTGGWDITLLQLYAPGGDTVFEIHADAGEVIDNIYINVDGPPAGSPLIVRALGDAPGYLRSVRNVLQSGSAETILNKVNVTEDIGSVQVEAIGDLIAGRDVTGPIIATTTDNSIRGVTSVQAGRNILGDITAENGRILLIYSSGGNVGSPGAPINIRAKHAVYQVQAIEVHANIDTRVNGGNGGFFALVANRFDGTLSTEQLIVNQYIPLDGLIYITQQFSGKIMLGKSFTSPTQYIQVPAHGLAGQIIINADNAVGGAWTSPVKIGADGDPTQIVLTSAAYPQMPSTVGGGSVGLVPFKLHGAACSPATGASVQLAPNASPMIVQLRHYGPVYMQSGGTMPVTIDRRVAGSGASFATAPMSDFAVNQFLTRDNILAIGAAPGKPGFATGYEYRLRPTPQLKCDVPSSPVVQWDSDYTFTVTLPPCDGDISGDGAVNVTDMLLVIAFWGPAQPAFPAADINHDGAVNVNDLLTVIGHWGMCW